MVVAGAVVAAAAVVSAGAAVVAVADVVTEGATVVVVAVASGGVQAVRAAASASVRTSVSTIRLNFIIL